MAEKDEGLQGFLRGYRRVIAWQKAKDLVVMVHRITAKFPKGEFRAIGQLNDAANSVAANIAEGYCRGSGGDYLRFLDIAHGSLGEVGSRMDVAYEVGHVSEEDWTTFTTTYNNTGFFLFRLMQGVRKKVDEGSWDHHYLVREGTEESEVSEE